MQRVILSLMLSAAVCSLSPAHAMEEDSRPQGINQNGMVLHIPEKFPGHNSRPIQGTVKVPDHFDPEHYQQDRSRKEGACRFNSLLAGIMQTEYGRRKIAAIFESQDDTHVTFKYYFPSYETVKEFEDMHKKKGIVDEQERLERFKSELEELQSYLKDENDEEEIKRFNIDIEDVNECINSTVDRINTFPVRLEKTFRVSDIRANVPKNFVTREDRPSFPHKNPEWVNLAQQSYLVADRNCMIGANPLRMSKNAILSEDEAFWGSFFYILGQGEYNKSYDETAKYLNRVGDVGLGYGKAIKCWPLIDIFLKDLRFYPDREKGIDLENTVDLQATIQGEEITYSPLKYNTITDYAHHNGLSKDLLMANNVVQIDETGHAVTLFFGAGKVMYYDNVFYNHPAQINVYGKVGPIHEEAKYFQGLSIDTMGEEEFFTRFFQEINHRREQVAQVRGKKALFELNDYGQRNVSTLTFFERPLVD